MKIDYISYLQSFVLIVAVTLKETTSTTRSPDRLAKFGAAATIVEWTALYLNKMEKIEWKINVS